MLRIAGVFDGMAFFKHPRGNLLALVTMETASRPTIANGVQVPDRLSYASL
jgi:hypothetical protein